MPIYAVLRPLAFWGVGLTVSILASKAIIQHYYLPAVPVLSLLSGVFLDVVIGILPLRRYRPFVRGIILFACLVFSVNQVLPYVMGGGAALSDRSPPSGARSRDSN